MKNIFISSTFRDMQAERDMVQERVLPALRDEARKYGDNVGVIDLRWGVDTSTLETEEGAAKVLKVCLDEIDRSHPYMLIFIGERYGWIPEGKLIEKALNGREDKYVTDDFAKSVTALEIEYGALSEMYGELDHCIVCFREPVVHMLDGAEKDLYAEHTEEGKRKLAALKEQIKRDLGEDDRLITYSCTWDKSARQLVDFTSNGQPLETVLTNCFVEMFRDDWKEYENLSWQDKEQLAFRALMESKLRSFVGREALLEEYYQSAVNGTCPIILQGEVGSGKTAIMCKLVERLQKEGKRVFAFFSGAGSMSTNAESLVKQMVYYMENLLGIKEHFEERKEGKNGKKDEEGIRFHTFTKGLSFDDWKKQLETLCLQLTKENRVFFCIDALDQLYPDEHVEELDFIPIARGVQVIASCTDGFELPMETAVNRKVKSIPALCEVEAKHVIGGMMAAYSRNVYRAIEEEILKKRGIGNPLYISLLIQRLNMMGTEELQKAITEKEIISLSVGIVREMPEEPEEAVVAIIRDGIDKISEDGDTLYEMLQYLAISRNGLRMSDLQEIFATQGKGLPVLDFTLLMKYLDNFFYMHEDARIDYTHKVIRQGVAKYVKNREETEEIIKEHLKKLYYFDKLRVQEGMYFARIRRDEAFAREIICHAYNGKYERVIRVIKNEAMEDGGKFYCELIEKEIGGITVVCDFFLSIFPDRLGLEKKEMQVKLKIGKALEVCLERDFEKNGREASLGGIVLNSIVIGNALQDLGELDEARDYYEKALKGEEQLTRDFGREMNAEQLSNSYVAKGGLSFLLGKSSKALVHYEKGLKDAEDLYKQTGSIASLRSLLSYYDLIGRALQEQEQPKEALLYCEKALKCAEKVYEISQSEKDLNSLSSDYLFMGRILRELGQRKEAWSYYEKSLRCAELLYKKDGNEKNLYNLSICYDDMCEVLWEMGQTEELLVYHEKALIFNEKLYERTESIACLSALSDSYEKMGGVHQELGNCGEALAYYEKALMSRERLYEKTGSEKSLRKLLLSCKLMGRAFWDLGRIEEALKYYEKSFKCAEIWHRVGDNEKSLKELSMCSDNVGRVLQRLGRSSEALIYYEKAIKSGEMLYESSGDEGDLKNLSNYYVNIGRIFQKMGKLEEVLTYYEKAVKCMELLYEQTGNNEVLQILLVRNTDRGRVLRELEKKEKAQVCYEKSLKYLDILQRASESEEDLRALSDGYYFTAIGLEQSGQMNKARICYERDLMCLERLQKKAWNEKGVYKLSDRYDNICRILMEMELPSEALLYYKKNLECMEILHEISGTEDSLRGLSMSYFETANILEELGRTKESLPYYEKMVRCLKALQELTGNEDDLRNMWVGYIHVGGVFQELGRPSEALPYCENALGVAELLYKKDTDGMGGRNLSISYNRIGTVLCDLDRCCDALGYFESALQYTEEMYLGETTEEAQSLMANRRRNIARALLGTGRLSEALELAGKAVEQHEKLYETDLSDEAEEELMKSLAIYAEALLKNNQVVEARKMYSEATKYSKSVCEKEKSLWNARVHVKNCRGMYLCFLKQGDYAKATEYLSLAKEEAEELYRRSEAENDKKLLEEILDYLSAKL